jgi:hypothetical protein
MDLNFTDADIIRVIFEGIILVLGATYGVAIHKKVKTIQTGSSQLIPNGGLTLYDKINRMETSVSHLQSSLESTKDQLREHRTLLDTILLVIGKNPHSQ